MSDPVLVAMIAALASLIASATAAFLSLHNAIKIQEVHLSINSRMDQLLKAAEEAAHAKGAADQRSSDKSSNCTPP
jgi:hypothetical protein